MSNQLRIKVAQNPNPDAALSMRQVRPSRRLLLSASGAHRWLNCTPSAVLESGEPGSTSDAAEQGTATHALAEWKLRHALHRAPGFKPESTWIDDEIETLTDDYVAFVQEYVSLAREACGDTQVLIEQRLDFSHVVPGRVRYR